MERRKDVKVGVQLLAYNQEEYIEYCIRAIYPFADLIHVMYSELPFTAYNRASRDEFRTVDRTKEILLSLPDPCSKISITEGLWDNEESMRNVAARQLLERGAGMMLIIDCDEFWPDGMLGECITYLQENLCDGHVAWVKCRTPFKRLDRLVDFEKDRLPLAVLLSPDLVFIDRRIPCGQKMKLPDRFYFWHLGYVLSNERMYEKIRTFSHAHEVPSEWFKTKWIGFTPDTKNLCRKDPKRWPRTLPMDPWDLPSILHTHPYFPSGPPE